VNGLLLAWVVAGAAAFAMLQIGLSAKVLSLPQVVTRCGACGRFVRRGRVCRCADPAP
jgi:hypothetical protein